MERLVLSKFLRRDCSKQGVSILIAYSTLPSFAASRGSSKPISFSMVSQSQSGSIEDIFESSLNLEDTHYKKGYNEGYREGLISGKDEGKQVGLKAGFEIGEELGFYRGCIDVWNSVIRLDPTQFSNRAQKSIKQLEELVENYPVLEPEDERVQEIMDALRLKFRVIRAGLGVKLEYDGYPKPKEIEF